MYLCVSRFLCILKVAEAHVPSFIFDEFRTILWRSGWNSSLQSHAPVGIGFFHCRHFDFLILRGAQMLWFIKTLEKNEEMINVISDSDPGCTSPGAAEWSSSSIHFMICSCASMSSVKKAYLIDNLHISLTIHVLMH